MLKDVLIKYFLILLISLFSVSTLKGQSKSIILSSKKEFHIDSIIVLLTKYKWTSCGRLDSINQYSRIQFINKELLKGTSNCTEGWASKTEWIFSDNPTNQKSLLIKYEVGWNAPDEMHEAVIIKWRWEYYSENKSIYLYEDDKVKYHLLISQISDFSLILSPINYKN